MNFTLVNYPLHSFTQEKLLELQEQGVKFQANNPAFTAEFLNGKWNFNGVIVKYKVSEIPSNIKLFEKLSCVKTPRKHSELIKAWVEDETIVIEYWNTFRGEWQNCIGNPMWCDKTDYRIKPSIKPGISEAVLKDIQQGLTTGIATCLAMLILKEEI